MNKQTFEMLTRLQNRGISESDAYSLRRIAMTLHRWHELECGDGNWYVERANDDGTGKPFMVNHNTGRRFACADRETGALNRLDAIMSRYPELAAYVQGDPRGASLYIYRKDSEQLANSKYGIESCYSSIGVAVYK